MQSDGYVYSEEIASFLKVIASTYNEKDRQVAISQLACLADTDAARALAQVFKETVWRETKMAILRALGRFADNRTMEFLLRVASDHNDLALASEAIRALSQSKSFVAGAFLRRIITQPEHPLFREAAEGLASFPYLAVDRLLFEKLKQSRELSLGSYEALLLAIGKRRALLCRSEVISLLIDPRDSETTDRKALLFAAGWLCDPNSILAGLNDGRSMPQGQDEIETHSALAQSELIAQLSFEARWQAWKKSSSMQQRQLLWVLLKDHVAAVQEQLAADDLWLSGEDAIETALLVADLLPPEVLIALIQNNLGDKTKKDLLLNLIDQWFQARNDKEAAQLLRQLDLSTKAQMVLALPGSWALETAEQALQDNTLSQSMRVEVVNQCAFLALVLGHDDSAKLIANMFLNCLGQGKLETGIKARIWRAFGQINASDPKILSQIEVALEHQPEQIPSIYYALGLMNDSDAAQWLSRRLRKLIERGWDKHNESTLALKALSEHDHIEHVAVYATLPSALQQKAYKHLLVTASKQDIPKSEEYVCQALDSNEFYTQMLGLAAAAHVRSDRVRARLLGFLQRDEKPLLSRSLYALAVRGSIDEHLALVDLIKEHKWQDELIEQLLHWIEPEPGTSYLPMIRALDDLVESEGIFERPQLRNAAINLRDNLYILEPESNYSIEINGEHLDAHQADEDIAQELAAWPQFSENIRSVLRNAELTFRHRDLFDERVDKSTIIVEYVKSIDLYLQEKLAPMLFFSGGQSLFPKLQSRIIVLQLDKENVPAERRIKDLQCEEYFDADAFPFYKLMSLSRSIVSGKILREQYRAVDGLRAWAIILLLFGRRFHFGRKRLDPVLKVNVLDHSIITPLAATLNSLQEMRNLAAHRGTVSSLEELQMIRQQSLGILAELGRIL